MLSRGGPCCCLLHAHDARPRVSRAKAARLGLRPDLKLLLMTWRTFDCNGRPVGPGSNTGRIDSKLRLVRMRHRRTRASVTS